MRRRNTINQIALCPIMLFCFKMGNVSTTRSEVVEIIFNNIYTQKSQEAYIDWWKTLILYIFRESRRRHIGEYYIRTRLLLMFHTFASQGEEKLNKRTI